MAERIRTVTPADLVDPAISVDELLKHHLEAETAAEFTAQIDAAIQDELQVGDDLVNGVLADLQHKRKAA